MELLYQLYRISSPSGHESLMMNFIRGRLDRLGVAHFTDHAGNIYATKGRAQSYPCIVSHTDEVHNFRETGFGVMQSKSKRNKIIFGFDCLKRRHCGIGADDKNGIWICLKSLEEFDTLKCVFFVGEETGCTGSSQADLQFFKNCRYVLQCDRKGNSDIVASYCGTALCSDEFLHDAKPEQFGYKQSEGLITDVIMLKNRGLQVSGVNLSCGYYLPHTPNEFTCVEDLKKCFRFVRHIIKNCKKTYCHKVIKKPEIKYYKWQEHLSEIPYRNSLYRDYDFYF